MSLHGRQSNHQSKKIINGKFTGDQWTEDTDIMLFAFFNPNIIFSN